MVGESGNNSFDMDGVSASKGFVGSKTDFSDFLSFKGRMQRREYAVIIFASILVILFLDSVFYTYTLSPIIYFAIHIIVIYVVLSSSTKRFRDLNRSGNYAALMIIPVVNIPVLLYLLFAPRKNDKVVSAFYKGADLIKQGRNEEALSVLRELNSSDLDDKTKGSIYYNIAVAECRVGNNEKAQQNLLDAIELIPKLASNARNDVDLSELFASMEKSKTFVGS